MNDLPFDLLNPPQLPPEARRVAGCSCGGLQWHIQDCSIWAVDHDVAQEAIAAAQARMTAHTDALNAALHAWQEARRD